MWENFEERVINLRNPRETGKVRAFLEQFDLSYETDLVEYTIAICQDEKIVATGSLDGEVLRNIAIDENLQGYGLSAAIVSSLMKEASRRGIYHYFIYTKPDKTHLFVPLGFSEVAVSQYAALLETGMGSVGSYCRNLAEQASSLPQGRRAALVVNCNPFTLGHQALIARAAEENAAVIVLVVEEDKSLFPFEARLRLVRRGMAEKGNVLVVPGGKYCISAATFPGYFVKGEAKVQAQARLDAVIFARHIAPALDIRVRYVGEEPYCPVTDAYNKALAEILPSYGIELKVIPRAAAGSQVISASKVRELIRRDEWEEIKNMVPETTYGYLVSEEAAGVIAKIKENESRH